MRPSGQKLPALDPNKSIRPAKKKAWSKSRRKTPMCIKINVHGLQFEVPVGLGKQKVKWLANVAAQRYSISQRNVRTGFHVPASVSLGFKPLDPTKQICMVLKNGDEVDVTLQSQMPVQQGKPVWATWSMKAYSNSSAAKSMLDRRLDDEQRAREREAERKRRAKEKVDRLKKIKTDIAVEEMRLALTGGKLDSEESIARAVQFDFSMISKNSHFERMDARPMMYTLKSIMTRFFTVLNDGFKYYSGLADAGETSTMSYMEFIHFVKDCNLVNTIENHVQLKQIFSDSNSVDVGKEHTLDRCEFIAALFYLAKLKYCDQHRSYSQRKPMQLDAAVEKMMAEEVVPVLEALNGGDIRKELHSDAVQIIIQRHMSALQKAYKHYAQIHTRSDAEKEKPTMDLAEFKLLVQHAGLVGGSTNRTGEDNDAHGNEIDGDDDLTITEVRMAFSGAQDDSAYIEAKEDTFEERLGHLHLEETQMVFHEFVEAVVRIAFAKWAVLAPKEKISLAIEAISSLAKTLPVEEEVAKAPDEVAVRGKTRKRSAAGSKMAPPVLSGPGAGMAYSASAPSFFLTS